MQRILLSLIFSCLSFSLLAQNIVFSEDFETPPGNVTSSGSPGWATNSRLQTGGMNCDSSFINAPGGVSYLTTNSFSCAGLYYVTLSFNGICKVEFFDAGTIEYSIDGGNTWFQLIDNTGNPGGNNNCVYLGVGGFSGQGSKFQEANYNVWQAGTGGVYPESNWWRPEAFDISQVAGGQADVRLRFKLADGNGTGGNNRAGWYVDDVQVVAEPCETIAPTLTQLSPFYPSTIYNLGPYTINADAYDQSGLNSLTVNYTVNGNAQPPLNMNLVSGTTYTASIPAVSAGDVICYYIEAVDGSNCDNTTYSPGPTSANTVCFTAQAGVTFPYCDFFDAPGVPWTGSGTIAGTAWEQGTPNYGATTGAYSGTACWDVNLNTAYANAANAGLISPELSFQIAAGAKLEFWMNYNTQLNNDGLRLEWSNNINGPWTLVGSLGCANCTNWYNSTQLSSSGMPGWSGNSGGWIHASVELDASYNNQPQVWFQFVFTSNGTVVADGVSIDNFCITLPEPDDVGVTSIIQPSGNLGAGNCTNVTVQVKNFGTNTQTNFPVSYNVGGNIVNGSYNGTLVPGATATVTLPCLVIPTGGFTICAYTGLSTDGNHFNDSTCATAYGIPTIPVSYSQQFYDNFTTPNTGWTTVGSATATTVWEQGSPTYGATNSSYSAPSCWDVNLTTAYGNNAICELISPLFDFTNAANAELSFWRNNNCQANQDGVRLDYRTNPNGAWTMLGTTGLTAPCWVNWYNGTLGSTNQGGWSGNSGGWVKSEAKCLSFLNGAPTVQFRFVFNSNATTVNDGFSVDDFRITVPTALNASPVSISTNAINTSFVFPGQPLQISSPISNPGSSALSSVLVTFLVDNNPVFTDTVNYSPALPTGQSLMHTFSQIWNASPGTHTLCAVTSYPNFGTDQNPNDDTTCMTISVFDTITVTTANPYCTDFESGSQWVSVNAFTYNATQNSWQFGMPSQTILNGTHSGAKAWMTNLTANYPNLDSSALFTPVFAVDKTKCYRLSFWHKFNTEQYADGGIVEYSTDNAATWQHLGFAATSGTWYNSYFVTALGGSPGLPGWSGTQANWTQAQHDVNFWNNGNVIFRFRFASDHTVNNYEGWAIDDFCFEEIPQPCLVGISENPANEFMLGQNYPNPFNNASVIPYSIPQSGNVKISIVNLVGQEVVIPVDGIQQAGDHIISINAASLRAGIYYYTMEYAGQRITRKMVITR